MPSPPAGCTNLVVVPTYNEAGNIDRLLDALLSLDTRVDVLVVDDGSPDGTARRVDRHAARLPGRVHLLARPARAGLGSAYRAGFAWAAERGYGAVAQMDADGSHPVTCLPGMLSLVTSGTADLVVGSRYVRGGGTVGWPGWRRWVSRCANAYVRGALGLRLRDATGGYRVWRGAALAAADPQATSAAGNGFLVEMAAAAERAGLRVVEVPITFTDRSLGDSKMSWRVAREAAWTVWACRRRFQTGAGGVVRAASPDR